MAEQKESKKQPPNPDDLTEEQKQGYLLWAQKKVGWAEMTEEEKKASYYEWAKEYASESWTEWMPWLENQYLKWFSNGDNKASYMTKDYLNQANVIQNEQVGKLTDTVGDQIKSGGLLGGVGDAMSSEGVDRMEKDGPAVDPQQAEGYTDQAQKSVKGVTDGVGSTVGGLTGGLTGGKK